MDLQKEIAARLAAAGMENAALEARLLCESLGGDALERAVSRRCQGYPLQYILGTWGFWREEYEVSEHCLIPRPDTELLVEKAIASLPRGARFLDLCAGSGCVAISTLASRPDTTAAAVDLFPKTLELAQRNAVKNQVASRIDFYQADVLEPPLIQEKFDAILSNPPYIQSCVMETLQTEVKYEPYAALCGGEDGLIFYRAILANWSVLLRENGFLLFEIGYDQAEPLKLLASEHGRSATVYRDYGGNDRVVLVR